jgi:hypothetical protein
LSVHLSLIVAFVVNRSDLDEKENSQLVDTSPLSSTTTTTTTTTTTKSVDELLLFDLDPSVTKTDDQHQDKNDKLERLKYDIQQLYASHSTSTTANNPSIVSTSILPDVISQQDETSTVTLPEAVEQLEIEVRQELLQHALDLACSSTLLPDLTTNSNGVHDEYDDDLVRTRSFSYVDEHNNDSTYASLVQHEDESKEMGVQNEPDLLQHETPSTPIVLHSVDSIVNLPDIEVTS